MVRCYAATIENDRGRTSYQSTGRAHRRGDVSRRKQFVLDQIGRRGCNTSVAGFIERDRELAESDGCIASNDTGIIGNAGSNGNTVENPTERIKAGLRARSTLSIRRKTTAGCRTGIGQLPRFVRCQWAGRCGSNHSLDRQFRPRSSSRLRTLRVALGSWARVEPRRADYIQTIAPRRIPAERITHGSALLRPNFPAQ